MVDRIENYGAVMRFGTLHPKIGWLSMTNASYTQPAIVRT